MVQAKKDITAELNYKMSEILKRLKILEERVHSFAEKLENINNDLINLKKSFLKFKTENNSKIEKIEKEIADIKVRLNHFDREMPKLVKKNEIETLRKVFSLWDPMNFVTEKELDFILNDKLEDLYYKILNSLKNEKMINFQNTNFNRDLKDIKIEKSNESLNNLSKLKETEKKDENKSGDIYFKEKIENKNKILEGNKEPYNGSKILSFLPENKEKEKIESFKFKHIKPPRIFSENISNLENIDEKENREENKDLFLLKRENNNLEFEDLVHKRNKKKENLENKFKEKIKKVYEDFKKDWEEI